MVIVQNTITYLSLCISMVSILIRATNQHTVTILAPKLARIIVISKYGGGKN